MTEFDVVEYLDPRGRSPFGRWFSGLDPTVAARVAMHSYRLSAGNFSNVKAVGAGVLEQRIDLGPGYRIYFARDGAATLVLLGGGSKTRQRQAIAAAKDAWAEYQRRRRPPL